MQIPILIEKVDGRGFRAWTGAPFALTAEGPTKKEAKDRLQQLVADHISAGLEVDVLEVAGPLSEHPLAKFSGWLPDDELTREWKKTIEENRRKADLDPEYY